MNVLKRVKQLFIAKKVDSIKTMSDGHLLNCFNKYRSPRYFNEMVIRLHTSHIVQMGYVIEVISQLFEEKISNEIINDFEDLT